MTTAGDIGTSFDERALVEAARTDADAFATLYQHYVNRVYGYAYRRSGSRQVAEDVTSATFARAIEKLDRFTWRASGFGPWLFRLAANELAEHHRSNAKHETDRAQRVLSRFHQPTSRAADPDPIALDQLRAAMSTLSVRHQRVLSLRYFADLDHADAAAAMGLSKSTFAVTLHRAKAALRKALERAGIDVGDLA